MIQARNISKQIKGCSILSDVSLDVRPGEVVGIIGPSGAGKSTLLRVIAGIESANSGQLNLCSHLYDFPCDPLRLHKPWPKTTLVFQSLCLWPHLSLRENVLMPLRQQMDMSKIERAEEYLEMFQIEKIGSRFPNQVSGGQRQLFALCRALSLDPDLLLLDEVTASLDVEHIRTLREVITDRSKQGVAIVFVSHSLGFVRKTANVVVFLDRGEIHENGPVSILSDPKTDRLKRFLFAADELNEIE